MKLVTLNIWGGKRSDVLINWFHSHRKTDIVCLQEVFSTKQSPIPNYYPRDCPDIYEKILEVLPNHQGVYCPLFPDGYGLATLVHKSITITDYGSHWIYVAKDTHVAGIDQSRCLQWLTLSGDDQMVTVFNIHGLTDKTGKRDSDKRFLQLSNIQNFVTTFDHPVILAGDFNVTLKSQFIRDLEKTHINLVGKYHIQSTRSSIYTGTDRYADYIFLPEGCRENCFTACPEEISDHYPLYCDFSIN